MTLSMPGSRVEVDDHVRTGSALVLELLDRGRAEKLAGLEQAGLDLERGQ